MRLLLASLALSVAASAQPALRLPLDAAGPALSVRAAKPSFTTPSLGDAVDPDPTFDLQDPDDFYGARTSAWAVGASVPVGPVRVVGEVPFALVSISDELYALYEEGGFEQSQTGAALGNVRLGVERDLPGLTGLTVGADVRLPTATGGVNTTDGDASGIGFISRYEEPGAFRDNLLTVSARASASRPVGPVAVQAQLAPALGVWTGDEGDRDNVGYLSYTVHAIAPVGAARAGAGVSGTLVVAGTEASAREDHEMSVEALADVAVGAFRPGVEVRVPVAGFFADVVTAVVGVGVTYAFD